MAADRSIVVWADLDQEQLVRDALVQGDFRLSAIGSPDPAAAAALAKSFDVPRLGDVREVIQHAQADMIWLASAAPLETDARRLLGEVNVDAASSAPPLGSAGKLISEGETPSRLFFVPLMRRSAGFRNAAEALPQFDEIRCVSVAFRSGTGQGSLYARMYDALDVVRTLCGQPETINAALAGPLANVPQRLDDLTGHMTINMRFKHNRCACVSLSDRAGTWFRGITVLGDQGCLRINDGGFEWVMLDGAIADGHKGAPAPPSAGELIGSQLARMLSGMDSVEAPPDNAALLALCEAARLSCLTGQDEAPARLEQMLSRP